MLKRLYLLNLHQSLPIIAILTPPLVFFLDDYHFAKTAALYFIITFFLYPFLYTISRLPKSALRSNLVTFTRIYIRFHIAFAIIGVLLIILHVMGMQRIISINSPRAISGYLALLSLLSVLITGYLRKRKSSGKRRRFHRYMSFLFIFFVLVHLAV